MVIIPAVRGFCIALGLTPPGGLPAFLGKDLPEFEEEFSGVCSEEPLRGFLTGEYLREPPEGAHVD